jgi:hypothetical protein
VVRDPAGRVLVPMRDRRSVGGLPGPGPAPLYRRSAPRPRVSAPLPRVLYPEPFRDGSITPYVCTQAAALFQLPGLGITELGCVSIRLC